MAAQTITPMPGAHERRIAERTRSGRLIRDSIALLSSKWSVDILLALGDGTRRYHELLEDLQPISEKVLTQTLRGMERDGVVARRVHAEVPPRVEYALTPLGATMAPPLKALGVVVARARQAGRGGARPVRRTDGGQARGRLAEEVVGQGADQGRRAGAVV